jgi:hypothetical protein
MVLLTCDSVQAGHLIEVERTVLTGADQKDSKEAEEKTLVSEWRSLLKGSLIRPTLLEMSGNPT